MKESKKKFKWKVDEEKTFVCPKNHKTSFRIGGKYEMLYLMCQKCNKVYELTKSEVDKL